jgi:hypothetical protein
MALVVVVLAITVLTVDIRITVILAMVKAR